MDSYSATAADDQVAGKFISTVHPDIIKTHIFSRLDGPSLVSAACASPDLHTLSDDENLWRDICTATWPSVSDPRLSDVISTFPLGHRSFFSDSYPVLDQVNTAIPRHPSSGTITPEVISAVDIYYRSQHVFSRVQETETTTGWFLSSPFRVDLLDSKESVQTRIPHQGHNQNTSLSRHLEENLTLSWILIDPTRKRAMNLSSRRPVSVKREWISTGDMQVRFATVIGGGAEDKAVECRVRVRWPEKEGGREVQVREVSLVVEGMEGRSLSGKESMAVLRGAMEGMKRKKEGKMEEQKERYEEFVRKKMVYRDMKNKKEQAIDFACMVLGVTIFITFWFYILFR